MGWSRRHSGPSTGSGWRTWLFCMVLFAMAPGAALAQNLIANPGFEDNPPPDFGNNINYPIPPWSLGPSGQTSNVVKVDGSVNYNYGSFGPELDANPASPAGVPQHYLDIASGANDFWQTFVVPICGSTPGQTRKATYSGWFSTRDNLAGGGGISIRSGAGPGGSVLSSGTIALPAGNSKKDAWVEVSGTVDVQAGTTVSYVVSMGNNLNFDQAFFKFDDASCASAPLTLRKTWSNAAVNDRAVMTATRNGAVVDTLASTADTANETDTDPTPLTVFDGETIVLAESLPGANAGTYTSSLACTGGGTLAGNILTVDDSGTPLVCTYTNTGPTTADLSITKSNNVSSVVSGSTTTYVVTVTNNGPDAVTGAMVNDTPGAGLDCPSANPVTCTSTATPSACPAGPLTVADLQSGVTLGNLPASLGSRTVTFGFSCTVQ